MLVFQKDVFWVNWPALDFFENLVEKCFFESEITKIWLRECWNCWRKLCFHCKINEYFSRFFDVLNCNFRGLLNVQFGLEKQGNLYEKMNKISWQFEDVLEAEFRLKFVTICMKKMIDFQQLFFSYFFAFQRQFYHLFRNSWSFWHCSWSFRCCSVSLMTVFFFSASNFHRYSICSVSEFWCSSYSNIDLTMLSSKPSLYHLLNSDS